MPRLASPSARVRSHLKKWAGDLITVDKQGYCAALADNFVQALSPATLEEFTEGDGGELGKDGGRGKLQALHSSGALACNFFDPWRQVSDRRALESALAIPARIDSISFERKFPTGVGQRSPNLDVVLSLDDGSIVAVESKFLEPYSASKKRNRIQDKYIAKGARWSDAGLPGCQAVVGKLRAGSLAFHHLDAAQVVKHMLGLAASRKTAPWKLLYLWYAVPGDQTDRHAAEISLFESKLGTDHGRFSSMTYQEVFGRLKNVLPVSNASHIQYLESRYFALH